MNTDAELLGQVISVLLQIINGGAGAVLSPVIFGAIEIADSIHKMSGNVKRGLALAMALLIPSIAYGVLLGLTKADFSMLTLLVACASGGLLAVKIHDELEARGWGQESGAEAGQ